MGSKSKRSGSIEWREVVAYVIVALLGLALGVFGMQVWKADLHVPFSYATDGILTGATVKAMIEHGWVVSNPSIGAPGGWNSADFPVTETLDFAIMKVISLFSGDWALTLNLFYLLTFPLTAVLAFWPMRRLGLAVWPAAAASLVYTILPYHFFRGEPHLGLAAYFFVPPMILVCIWALAEDPLLFAGHGAKRWKLKLDRRDAIIAIVICLLTAFGGIYYAFFACFFLFVAGAIAALRHGKGQLLVSALVLIAVIVVGAVVNMSPSLVYHRMHGGNPAGSVRNAGQAEIYGLKIDQMFLPVDGHRIGKFAAIKALYHTGMQQMGKYLDNEAVVTSPLGIIGVLAFLLVLFALFVGEPGKRWLGTERFELLQRLSGLQIFGVLLATVGGFGAMVAFVIPEIRSYNRIVVFLAYFGALGLALVLDRLWSRAHTSTGRALGYAGLLVLLAFAVFDQTSSAMVPDYRVLDAAYQADGAYVATLQKSLPSGAAVFQLPYMPFPEPGGPLVKMPDYEPLRGYLHSTTLKWSYGAQKGRQTDAWQRQTATLPADQMVAAVRAQGFSAVWVDRNGYEDNGAAIEGDLQRVTGHAPLVSGGGEFATFVLGR